MSTDFELSASDKHVLLEIAAQSIAHGLQHGSAAQLDVSHYSAALRNPGAAFVTLHDVGELRGCIGSLEACRPLAVDVAENAFAAAFHDPRFTPLRREEFPTLELHISVLGPATPMHFKDEADAVAQLRPGIDGLILRADGKQGTFLPSVWQSLPQPEQFLAQLKRKAGLSEDYWSDRIELLRYSTVSFPSDQT